MNGPIIAYLDGGRKLYWNKVEQGVAEASWVNGKLQQPEDLVWKQTSLSYEQAVNKYGKEAVRREGKNRLGQEVVAVHVPLGGTRTPALNVAEGFNGEYDDEAGMAQSNLRTMARAVDGLLQTIKKNDNLPEWGQEKIAKAEMMLVSVWDYLLSQKEMGMDPKQSVAESNWYELRLSQLLESNLKK